MQVNKFLRDAVNAGEGDSNREVYIAVADQINASPETTESITWKGVAKWDERGTIPSNWMMMIAALPANRLDIATYA